MLFILLLFIQFIITVYGGINNKFKASCVVLKNDTRIYCYSGGYNTLGDSSIQAADADHNYLDLTQDGLTLGSIAYKWTSVPDDPNFKLEPAIGGTPVKLSDTSYLIDGGYYVRAFRKNQTIGFDANTNTWSSHPNDGRGVTGQIYGETGVYVESKGTVTFWGGLNLEEAKNFSFCNSGQFPGTLLNNSSVLQLLHSGSWRLCNDTFNGTNSRYGHTATYDERQKRILYIGGSTPSNQMVPIKNITIFSTLTLDWTIKTATGKANITDRFMHTATRLPSTGMILIYGGATDDGKKDNNTLSKPVQDYIYMFNPNTFEFSNLEALNKTYSAGPRYGHSAVFSNNTVIILFGVDNKSIVTNGVYFLQMNNGAATWLNEFRLSISESRDSSLAIKEIIGITVGSVICGSLIIIGICYYIYKKKKKNKENKESDSFDEEDEQEEQPVYVMQDTFSDPLPPPPSLFNVYKPNQIVSDYSSSKSLPILEHQTTTIKPSL